MSLKFIILLIPLVIILYFAGLSFSTRHSPIKAEPRRTLNDCPDTPNCVFSQASKPDQKITPFDLSPENPQSDWDKLISIIKQQGGDIMFNDGTYCHAVFTSTIFRFKDDLELLRDDNQVQIRSASRAGKSDLGVNRRRVEAIRAAYTEK